MLKRLFDLIISVSTLLVLSPILALVATLVCFQVGKPVFFAQKRPGLRGEPFYMFKFRTMTDAVDDEGNLLPDTERITALGSFLRSTSLDELPELWNVVKGDMSLIGPRPLLFEYLDYYTEEEVRRHHVLPGITGLAQVNGRNNASWNDRLALDVEYVDNQSLWLDLKILAKTVKQVLSKSDVVVVPSTRYQKLSDERRGNND